MTALILAIALAALGMAATIIAARAKMPIPVTSTKWPKADRRSKAAAFYSVTLA